MKKTLFLIGALFTGSAAFAAEDSTATFDFTTTNDVNSIQIDAADSVLSITNASIDVTGNKTLAGTSGTELANTPYLAPNTNVQNPAQPNGQTVGPWTLTFELTNNGDQNIVLTGIDLSAFSFNSVGNAQGDTRTIDLTVKVGNEVFIGGTGTELATGFDLTTIDTTGSFTLAAGSSVTISISADENADKNEGGTYVGLTGGSISYQVTPEPTTATLSLLALAGLCARRRRK